MSGLVISSAMLRVFAALAVLMLGAPAWAADASTAADFAARSDAYIQSKVATGEFSGSVLIAYDGQPILRKAYGLANRELDVPDRIDTEYEIGSTTKTFTAVAIGQLVQARKLSLDERLSKFIPDPPAAWADITIAHLLSHESGLPEYSATTNSFRALMRAARTPEEVLALVRPLPLKFPPGSRYDYTNTDFLALGLVIQAVSGEPYEAYVAGHILAPLHLAHTGFLHAQALIPGRASGYMKGDDGWDAAFYVDPSNLFAAGSMYSTVDDLLVWDRALHDDTLLPPALRTRMFTDRGHGYGLGFFVDQVNGMRFVGHGGSLPGFSSDFERFSDRPLTFILLSNTYLAPTEKMTRELAVLYDTMSKTAEKDNAR